MSTVDVRGERIVLPREPEPLRMELSRWAGRNRSRWRLLAAVALIEQANWTQQMVAAHLGCTQGAVAKMLERARRDLNSAFRQPAPRPRGLADAAVFLEK